jgi:uncharacterized membrane protein
MGMAILYSTETPRHNATRMAQGEHDLPAWRRRTEGENIAAVGIAIIVAIALTLALPERIANKPRFLLPGLAVLLLVVLVLSLRNMRFDAPHRVLRTLGIVLIAILSFANGLSAARLIVDILRGEGLGNKQHPAELLLVGGAIWLTNVILFGIWYWGADRGGAVQRMLGTHERPDFLFPQMQLEERWARDWEPEFVDYFYLSFTNATAFSPTDVMPLARWAKLTMMVQAAISIMLVVLVVARAVNILG